MGGKKREETSTKLWGKRWLWCRITAAWCHIPKPYTIYTHICKPTFNEITNLRPDMSFLQVLNHSVGDSSQMTHVTSPGPTFSSRKIRGCKPTAIERASMLYYIPLIKSGEKLKQLILNSVILLPGIQNPLHQATLLEELHNTHRQKGRLDY